MASLNSRKRISDIIGEGLDIRHTCSSCEERDKKDKAIFEEVRSKS